MSEPPSPPGQSPWLEKALVPGQNSATAGNPEPLLFLWARWPLSWVDVSRTGVFRDKFRAALLRQIASKTVLSGF